jgi:hypothetical protein
MATDIKDVELFSLFALQPEFSEASLTRLRTCWETRRRPQETLANWLVRERMLAPEALRTLDLVRKGFQSYPEVKILFRPSGWNRLMELLASRNGSEADSKIGIESSGSCGSLSSNSSGPPSSSAASLWDVDSKSSLFTLSDSASKGTQNTPLMEPAARPMLGPFPQATAASELQLGSVLGKCLLTEIIGKGGFGTVYRALHMGLNITVAVKVLNRSALQRQRGLIARLQHEAKLLAQLNHPNIIRVFDFETQPLPYVVLEHVEGLSMGDLIQQCGGLRLRRTTAMIIETAEALAAAWKLGIIHRDVKPANILVARNSTVKLADLGLAVATGEYTAALTPSPSSASGENASANVQGVGTVAYMSPEQIRGLAELDCRSDIYSLGATFYHAATGALPFSGKSCVEVTRKHLEENPVPPMRHMPNLHPYAAKIILRMLAKRPEDRYADYAELLADLRTLASRIEASSYASVPGTQEVSAPKPAERPSGFWRSLSSLFGRSPTSGDIANQTR